jgi:hypothetical protein
MCYGCNQTKGNGDKLNGSYGHFCKWPKAKVVKGVLNPKIGDIVWLKGNKGKKNTLLGKIVNIGINPHTNLPACKTELKPNSWFHFSQLGRI